MNNRLYSYEVDPNVDKWRCDLLNSSMYTDVSPNN